MNKDLIINLLTGIFAKGLRYALASVGGAVVAGSKKEAGFDVEQLSAGAAALVVSVVWSWWEDRVRKKQVDHAMISVAAGATPTDAMSSTSTMNKIGDNLHKTTETPKPLEPHQS